MTTLLFASLTPAAFYASAPRGVRTVLGGGRARSAVPLAVEGGGGEPATAESKKTKAERLAIAAERASLEAERLSLLAEQMKLETALKRGDTLEDAPPLAPPPAPSPAASPSDASKASDGAAGEGAPSGGWWPFGGGAGEETPGGGGGGASQAAQREGGGGDGAQDQEPPSGALEGALRRMGGDGAPLRADQLQLSDSQVAAVRRCVLEPSGAFYVLSVQQSPLGTIFRGNLRAEPSALLEALDERAPHEADLEGVRLLVLSDPVPRTAQQLQAGEEAVPVVLALSPAVRPLRVSGGELGLAALSLGATGLTTLGYALSSFLLANDGQLLEALNAGDTSPVATALPIAAGIGALLVLHEGAHAAAAAARGVRIAPPVPVPSLQLGCFGCVTRVLDFPRSRAALYDVAASGPYVALAASLAVFVVGLSLSAGLPPPPAATDAAAAAAAASGIPTAALVGATPYPVVPSALLHSSLLLGSLADWVLPPLTPDSLAVQLHPAAVVGFTSALCNALQLLPVGRLDGGRIAAAVLGSGAASLTSSLFLLGLGLQSLFGGDDPALLFFGLLIIFFQREPELPCADDLTGVDTPRQAAAAAALAIALLIVAPSPLLG